MTTINGVAASLAAQPMLAGPLDMATVHRAGTIGLIVMAVVGLVLLLFGVKLVRLVYMVLFAGLGAAVGAALGARFVGQVGFAQLPWATAIGAAALCGLLGYLLTRIWVILTFGAVLAVVGAGVFMGVGARGEWGEVRVACSDTYEAAHQHARAGNQAAANEVWWELPAQVGKIIRPKALWLSLSAVVGLAVGLLVGGFAYRLAVILLTSLCGLNLLLMGLVGLAATHWPGSLRQVQGMGWKAGPGVLGAWLIGVAIQAALARKPAQPEPGDA